MAQLSVETDKRGGDYVFGWIGFPFAPRNHERLRSQNAFLGVVTDFTTATAGYILMRVKEKR